MTTQNATTEAPKEKSVALESAKKRFDAREKPASEKDVKAAFVAYFKSDDEIAELEAKIADLRVKRTAQCQEIVALRGSGSVNITGRGVGRIMARAESAWIVFPTADAGPALTL